MTNKIIIDGIDVSKCKYNYISITNDICCYAESERKVTIIKCNKFPNCMFKQLKRKEQECEELKEENYQLQKNCQICENFIDGIPCKPLRDIDYDFQKVINQRDKYKQVLNKIEKYCEGQNLKYDTTACDILDIINKAKGE